MDEKNKKILEIKEAVLRYHRHKNSFPKIDWLMTKLNLSRGNIVTLLRILEQQNFIIRKYSNYYLNDNQPKIITNIEQKKTKQLDWQILIIRFIMGVTGIGASFLSIYYTKIFADQFLPPILSIILSCIMVLFSVFMFDIIIITSTNKNWLLLFSLSALWLLTISLSMYSTVHGQYNSKIIGKKQDKIGIIKIESNKFLWESMKKQEKEIEELIDLKEIDLKNTQKLLKEFDDLEKRTEKWRIYWNTVSQRDEAQKTILLLRGQLKEIRDKKISFIETVKDTGYTDSTTIKKVYFADWLAKMFPFDPEMIRFTIYTSYAIFIDVIAPIAIAASMFLRRKEKNG